MVDINREQAEKMAAEFGGRVFDSAEALAREVDAFYICLPPFAHGEAERAAIHARKPFFVEKPVALTMQTAREIEREVARTGLITCVGYHWRYSMPLDRAREILAGATIGMVLGYWMGGGPKPGTTFRPGYWWGVKAKSGGLAEALASVATETSVDSYDAVAKAGPAESGDHGLRRGGQGLSIVDSPAAAGRKVPNLVDRGLLRRHPHVARDVHRLRVEEANIGDTDEAEDCPQVGLDVVEGFHGLARVVAPARRHADHLPAFDQSLDHAVRGVREEVSRLDDRVDVVLQGVRDAEVPHRDGQQVYIRVEELLDRPLDVAPRVQRGGVERLARHELVFGLDVPTGNRGKIGLEKVERRHRDVVILLEDRLEERARHAAGVGRKPSWRADHVQQFRAHLGHPFPAF